MDKRTFGPSGERLQDSKKLSSDELTFPERVKSFLHGLVLLVFGVALIFGAIESWPSGVFDTPLAQITLGMLFRVLMSLGCGLVGPLMLIFGFVMTVVVPFAERTTKDVCK